MPVTPASFSRSDRRQLNASQRSGEVFPAVPLLASLVALCLILSVSFQIYDADFWWQLSRARALLTLRTIPQQQIWTWPDYGAPDHNATWGHALFLWPFWSLGGVLGLFASRWLLVLATFGIAWLTARRQGAKGLSVFVVLIACAMVYRLRSQMRPEALALVLMAAEIWILETRRCGGRDHAWWLVAIAWLWPSAHISYVLGLLIAAVFLLDELLPARVQRIPRSGGKTRVSARASDRAPARAEDSSAPRAKRARSALALVLPVAVVASLLNPLGWSVLSFPFYYSSVLRAQGFDRMIAELSPLDLASNWRTGLPILMVAWPVLQIWRLRRGRFDRVAAILCVAFTYQSVAHERFVSFWAVAAAPYLARDLDDFIGARRLPGLRSLAAQTALTGVACMALTALECTRPGLPLGLHFKPGVYPVAACDFMERAGVRGRGFNYFEQGGYLLWRFWPDRTRLPFMTNAPELSSPEVRMSYWRSTAFREDWRLLADRYRLDFALLKRRQHDRDDHLLDFLDADSSFSLVFVDDVSALYVRRNGPLAAVASRFGYRWVSGGEQRRVALGPLLLRDSTAHSALKIELEREIRSSPRHAHASFLLGAVLMMEGAWTEAEPRLDEAHRLDSELAGYFLRKGVIALATGRPREAVGLLEAERRITETPEVDLRLAMARQASNQPEAAMALLEQAVRRFPGERALLDTLEAWRDRPPAAGGRR